MEHITFDSEENEYHYVVGIDLGTTNSAAAFADRSMKGADKRGIRFLGIPQLVSAGEAAQRPVLPSFLYLPGPYELSAGSTALPWAADRTFAVGEFAREQGALVAGRLVTSAKSWLSHGGVDRTAPILPWGAGKDVEKVSPVEASARYLRHLRESWSETMARGREERLLENQLVILTVPASFDEVARELTIAAAREAGIPRVILVEEPLAAFYAWLSRNEDSWESRIRPGEIILVCDVGGGTTDFTIIAAKEGEKGPRFDRLAVGEHLMLGGDNMDLTLARRLEVQLMGQPGKMDAQRHRQLIHACRRAKEELLGDAPKRTRVDVTLMGSGGKLIAGTLKGSITLEEARELILEGFFPHVGLDEPVQGARRSGITEWGLPYVQDPAVTRHMAVFWRRFRDMLARETGRTPPRPDFILFNGGALTPAIIRQRIREVVGKWFEEESGEGWIPEELENPRPELSVAIGAAYYGLVRLGEGVRVGAGSPRSYYVGVGDEGIEAPEGDEEEKVYHRAVCIVPRGTEEGFETLLEQPTFEALANRPAAFQLYSSHTRLGDGMGDVVLLPEEEIATMPPIRTVLRYGKKGEATAIPVRLGVRLTEVGVLELWCLSEQTSHKWRLQFDVRQGIAPEEASAPSGETLEQEVVEQARGKIAAVFQQGAAESMAPEKLVKEISSVVETAKDKWPTPLIRSLADALLEQRLGRSITAQHESRWLNLLGFCMRPGVGDPVDAWRIREAWKLFPAGPVFPRQPQCRLEWWVFWRRVAGGLNAGQQLHIYQQVSAGLPLSEKKRKGAKKQAKRFGPQEETEVLMMLANFERLPPDVKVELGRCVLERIERGKPKSQDLWALGRFGARAPLYGPFDRVIPAREAASWLCAALGAGVEATEGAGHALVQLALKTGDRERDLPDAEREGLAAWLRNGPHAGRLLEILENPDSSLRAHEQEWIFGEALPSGITLAGGRAEKEA